MMNRISRRHFMELCCLGAVSLGWGSMSNESAAAEYLDYETLSLKLYVKNEREENWLKDVVAKRDKGLIPLKLFYAAYNYALKKNKATRIYYFDICLTNLCKKAGLKLKFPALR